VTSRELFPFVLEHSLKVADIATFDHQLGADNRVRILERHCSFHTQEIAEQDATLYVRVGGRGPAVVLLHGFGDTGDMWAPLAAEPAHDHTVIVPDLRGRGLSSHPARGYDKMTQAADIRAVLNKLGIDHSDIVGHDIGTMVAYAYAARYPDKTDRLIVMDAPIPGIPPWNDLVRSPLSWHFSFGGPDAERLMAGRERIYLDRFYSHFAADCYLSNLKRRIRSARGG
jgi:pimeloyl-ACP methyl ester carboxylesterase